MSDEIDDDKKSGKDSKLKFFMTRRGFLQTIGAAGALYWLGPKLMFGGKAVAAIPGGTLPPSFIPKFQTPLLIPPVMPKAATLKSTNGKNIDYYEISIKQFNQQILPAGLPATTVWGYGPEAGGRRSVMLHNAPSLTIEARVDTPVRIKWINKLVDSDGKYLHHLLPVDPTLHWANPPGGSSGRDSRPDYSGMDTPERYMGPVPMVTHVHGAVGVGDESDGYAEAWYLPNAIDIPGGYATEGTWYDFFAAKASDSYGATWGPGYAIFQYPNRNRASTIWYHDHTLGMTRLNVYAGPAGFYLLRGKGNGNIYDLRTGVEAILPGPAPMDGDTFPSNKRYYEIPIVIQDRSFNSDGSLFYPDSRTFFDEFAGPYIPGSRVPPIWNPEFFGNTLMVNGNTWPFLTVEKRRYRLRFLNGCQSRFLILDFSQIPGVEVWMIGNDGGFLSAPVNLTTTNGNQLLMALAERADLIVDFTDVMPGNYILHNAGPDAPFGGLPIATEELADPDSTGQVMEFRVVPALSVDTSTPAEFLQLPPMTPLAAPDVTRRLVLAEEMSDVHDGPSAALLGTIAGNPNTATGTWTEKLWMEPVTENPALGSIEEWEIYNTTEDAHPIHVHEVVFQVINRQDIVVDMDNKHVQVAAGSIPVPPESWESGVKDTVVAYPGQVTRIRAQFPHAGQYTWHCHIIEHEDNEMMRPYRIGPVQPGEPGSMA